MLYRLTLLTFACAVLLAQKQPDSDGGSLVAVNGHKMWVRISGAGPKTVVFDSGVGENHSSWRKIEPEVAKFARVVVYNRAGLGRSELGAEPRSYTRIATELHDLLQQCKVPPPYVLVGHSFGGANVRAFAKLYERETAGLVLIDPLNIGFLDFLTRDEIKATIEREPSSHGPAGPQAEMRFLGDDFNNGFAAYRSIARPLDVPWALIIATLQRPPHWVEGMLKELGPWVAAAAEASMVVTSDSRHHVQIDQPDVAISMIRRVVFPSSERLVARAMREKGAAAAVSEFRELSRTYPRNTFTNER